MRLLLTFGLLLFLLGSRQIYASKAVDSITAPTGACASTITHSSSHEIVLGNSVSCNNGQPTYYHLATGYWRAFNMNKFANLDQYNITSVSFGIEVAVSGSGSGQPATITIYTNTGSPFPNGTLSQIASTQVTVVDQSQEIMSVPLLVSVPAGTSEIVMEVFTPSGVADHNVFFVGTNPDMQTDPSYMSAPGCGNPNPTNTAVLGFPNAHIIFDIHGSCSTGTQTPASALNLSTRLRVEPGEGVMIGGFIITNAPTSLILRGIGPSLANFGVNDALNDPFLEMHGSGGGLISQNNNWQDDAGQAAQISGAGLAPSDPRESGIATTQPAGTYTAVLTGTGQGAGVGLVEVYNITPTSGARLGNISTRGLVQTDTNVMIGGFILGGSSGSARVALRGIGPTLGPFGISNPLADPTLELHDGSGTTLAVNDNWNDDPVSAAQLAAAGLSLQNNMEAGIFITLPPGTYSAVLAGKNGGVGVGLVEAYNLQ